MDKANRQQKLGLVWRNIKKISQIIKDYFYLPFFLLIILCRTQTDPKTSAIVCNGLIGTILDPSLFWPASTFKELFCRKR
jgi:hypothetical protein